MREIRTSGSEGGGVQTNELSLPLSSLWNRNCFTMDARVKPGHDESAAASMEHLLAAREQRSDLFDGEINFQIQLDLAELRRSKLRISSNPRFCVGQGNLVFADPLSLLFKVEQRRGIRN